jgi:2-polyprenyl-3-methyl-5-hydroxy-6-metoxy-1,4-benzoquinol methylase
MSLQALLALDGMAFVDAAYHTILDRAPDDAGIAYFMREMAAGTSKVVLLGHLQRSTEGRQTGRSLPGLRQRFLAHRLYRIPVIGPGVRAGAAVLRVTGISSALTGGRGSAKRRRAEQAAQLAMLTSAHEANERRAQAQDVALDAATRRIAALQARLDDVLGVGRQASAMEALTRRLTALEEQAQRIAATATTQGRSLSTLVTQGIETGRRLSGLEDSSLESMLAMSDSLEDHAARLSRLEGLLNGEAVAAQIERGAGALQERLDERLGRTEAAVAQNRQQVIEQDRRIGLMLDSLSRRGEPMPAALQAEDDRAVEELYVDFEDRFRGSRADIKQRLAFYLPILAESSAGAPGRPVLDVGCGRGEFLELLRETGLTARGVDANNAMVAVCSALGLDCTADDALAYLGRQPPGSLGAVTGFHIIEHLPFKTMVRLFDAAFAALAPGGIMVWETPNPANLLVASRWFYLDPTHRNPLPGEMVAMIAEARGFVRVSIVELHPMDLRFGGQDLVLREQLDALFHGPQDYALLARKP